MVKYRVHTLWLTASIPGISIRVPEGFILPPVIVFSTTPVVSVIVISAVWKHFRFTLECNHITLYSKCFECQESPVCRIPRVTSEVLVSALRATVPVIRVTRVATWPRLSTCVPPITAVPRLASITAVPRLASITPIHGWTWPRPGLFAVPITAIRGPERKVIN